MLFWLDALLSLAIFPLVWRVRRELREWVRVPPVAAPADAPLVAVLVPARNEERSIARCVSSLLAQEYPRDRLQVLAIDDRSTDRTPQILAELAAQDPRLKVLSSEPLPRGWMGKCWALQQAATHADPAAKYLVFVDADTVHQPLMLASVVAHAEREGLDLLSLAPDQELGSEAEKVLLPTILGTILVNNGTISEVNDPARVDVAKAIGQFLLFRAEAYRAIGGHEAVKGDIVEDFAVARRMKGVGFRIQLADGRDLVRTRMYHSAKEIWDGFTKNAFAESSRIPGGAPGALVTLVVLTVTPYLALWSGAREYFRSGSPRSIWQVAQAKAQLAALVYLGSMMAQSLRLPKRYGLSQPLALLFLVGILGNSTWRSLSGRGVVWKGRTY